MDTPEILYVAKKRVFEMVGRKEVNLVLQALQHDLAALKELSDRAMAKLEATGEMDEELLDEIVDSIVNLRDPGFTRAFDLLAEKPVVGYKSNKEYAVHVTDKQRGKKFLEGCELWLQTLEKRFAEMDGGSNRDSFTHVQNNSAAMEGDDMYKTAASKDNAGDEHSRQTMNVGGGREEVPSSGAATEEPTTGQTGPSSSSAQSAGMKQVQLGPAAAAKAQAHQENVDTSFGKSASQGSHQHHKDASEVKDEIEKDFGKIDGDAPDKPESVVAGAAWADDEEEEGEEEDDNSVDRDLRKADPSYRTAQDGVEDSLAARAKEEPQSKDSSVPSADLNEASVPRKNQSVSQELPGSPISNKGGAGRVPSRQASLEYVDAAKLGKEGDGETPEQLFERIVTNIERSRNNAEKLEKLLGDYRKLPATFPMKADLEDDMAEFRVRLRKLQAMDGLTLSSGQKTINTVALQTAILFAKQASELEGGGEINTLVIRKDRFDNPNAEID